MIFGFITLITALIISAVAIYYSVAGLAAIFAAAVVPIVIMGVALELGKLVTAVWLHRYWSQAAWWIRTYLSIAVVVLMFITSMGIFGFLSKAHMDQTLVSGDAQAKIALYDEKIKTQQDNIEAARRALQQMDAQVNEILGRSNNTGGAERAVQVRRNQAQERTRLQKEISDAQVAITKLREERAPLAAEVRKVEAEVGPIKYIAEFIYGDRTDHNTLEEAVRWVIVILIFVFDPLAVLLLIAAQMTFKWHREQKEALKKESDASNVAANPVPVINEEPKQDEHIIQEVTEPKPETPIAEEIAKPYLGIEPVGIPEVPEETKKKDSESLVESKRLSEQELDDLDQRPEWQEAKIRWKSENPNLTLKFQKKLYLEGKIDALPWEQYVEKKDYIVKENSVQVKRSTIEPVQDNKDSKETYIQNAEQNETSIWNKIKNLRQQ